MFPLNRLSSPAFKHKPNQAFMPCPQKLWITMWKVCENSVFPPKNRASATIAQKLSHNLNYIFIKSLLLFLSCQAFRRQRLFHLAQFVWIKNQPMDKTDKSKLLLTRVCAFLGRLKKNAMAGTPFCWKNRAIGSGIIIKLFSRWRQHSAKPQPCRHDRPAANQPIQPSRAKSEHSQLTRASAHTTISRLPIQPDSPPHTSKPLNIIHLSRSGNHAETWL
ncbi:MULTISPECIES: hypothetical protein [unclassified Neisseria]|uniref:hypothetical protein n=1 Tax=unclassified Neisseria TaxID=2623750 RepID=UPI001071BD00|nr:MULTISPECIES: hypothetical protein [unclassified Neisseria]MBF0804889.1 hypothetical protein [Neisseria sp. 19428wB4_WF04]TFU39405.1 hypothetical protein E4T99_11310 [Neisseria sp. WF04]